MKKFEKYFTVFRWVVGIMITALVFYFGYSLYTWIKTLFTLPTKAAPGKTINQTLQDYLAAKVPPPSPLDNPTKGVVDLVTTDELTFLDKVYLYLDTLNPFRSGGIFGSK